MNEVEVCPSKIRGLSTSIGVYGLRRKRTENRLMGIFVGLFDINLRVMSRTLHATGHEVTTCAKKARAYVGTSIPFLYSLIFIFFFWIGIHLLFLLSLGYFIIMFILFLLSYYFFICSFFLGFNLFFIFIYFLFFCLVLFYFFFCFYSMLLGG